MTFTCDAVQRMRGEGRLTVEWWVVGSQVGGG